MRVFVSWSGSLSSEIAQLLSSWIPDVIQEIETWVSTDSITKGVRWSAEVSSNLDQTNEGIFCVTRENQGAPWLNFEAGAIAKSTASALARPLLVDLSFSDLTGPLSQFQATALTDKEDMWRLFLSLNASCAGPLKGDVLLRAFERTWLDYSDRARTIVERHGTDNPAREPRTERSMIEELLLTTRAIERLLGQESTREGSGRYLPTVQAQRWQRVLDVVIRRRRTTHAILINTAVERWDDNSLILRIGSLPLSRLLRQQVNLDVIAAAVREVTGQTVDVTVVVPVTADEIMQSGSPPEEPDTIADDHD